MRTRSHALVPVLVGAAALVGPACAPGDPPTTGAAVGLGVAEPDDIRSDDPGPDDPGPDDTRPERTLDVDPTGSLTPGGVGYLERLEDAPVYDLVVEIDPATGEVAGSVSVDLPADDDEARFRWFPNLPALDADAGLSDVSVDGRSLDADEVDVDDSIVTIPLDAAGDRATVAMSFSYRIPLTDTASPLSDGGLSLDGGLELGSIGLLGRTDDVVALGHWYPVWLDGDVSAEPDPDGYGDIGNFPVAIVMATITVPDDAIVITGGVASDETDTADGSTTSVHVAAGLRDLGMVVMTDAEVVEQSVGDGDAAVTVRVAATADAAAHVDDVLEESVLSIEVLSEALAPYPWRELDVVAVPLGSGVGGMEWPGMIWIEPSIFAGSVPGLGDLGDLGELGGLLDLIGPMLGDDMGLAIETMRPWVVAHEVAHMWWHAMVGNDSVQSPIVDEPLAQHAACLVVREARPADGDAVCEAQTFGQYRQLVGLLGVRDAPADRPTTEFDSSMQYGAVVYGKAPGLYLALEDEFGVDAVTAALAAVVDRHTFEQIDGPTLAAALADELDDADVVDELWDRWMLGTHGDEDIGVAPGGDIGGLFDLGGLFDVDSMFELDEEVGPDVADRCLPDATTDHVPTQEEQD